MKEEQTIEVSQGWVGGMCGRKRRGAGDISGSPEDPKQSSDCLSIRGEEEEKVGELEGAMETKPSCSASS